MVRNSTVIFQRQLDREAAAVALILAKRRIKLVLAESCTGGLVSATLVQTPGISRFLCGASVVYQAETKRQWLGISDRIQRQAGTESEEMTRALALSVLKRTRQADFAASITGDLGPLPKGTAYQKEGLIFLGVAFRPSLAKKLKVPTLITQNLQIDLLPIRGLQRIRRIRAGSGAAEKTSARHKRQILASFALLSLVRTLLTSSN